MQNDEQKNIMMDGDEFIAMFYTNDRDEAFILKRIQERSDVNIVDEYGNCALIIESRKTSPRTAIMNSLLDKGANPYLENINCHTAIEVNVVRDLVGIREEKKRLENEIKTNEKNYNHTGAMKI